MDCKYLIVSSVTYAMKARAELESHGILSKIEKIKNIKNTGGCGYGIAVSAKDLNFAVRILNNAGIGVLDVVNCGGNK